MLMSLFQCKVLFWQDGRSWAGGRWAGETVFYELEQRFETKAHWYALNQNAITRNYQTVLLRHSLISGKRETTVVGRFPGWALENSFYVLGDRAILIRGTSDVLGGPDRELIAVGIETSGKARSDGSAGAAPRDLAPVSLLRPTQLLLAAMPAPDGSRLAVLLTTATMQKQTGEVFVELYTIGAGGLTEKESVRLEWSGAPGMPNLAWAIDSSRFFVHRNSDVIEVAAKTAQATQSRLFPKCWLQSTSNVSDGGQAFFRVGPEGLIEIRKNDEWIAPSRVPLVGQLSKVGEGCP